MHRITARETRIIPDDGFILGNGDISVSVYCDVSMIGFRLGKGDVWDRRIAYAYDPDPADIREFKYGVEVEGWKCGPYGEANALGEKIVATKAPAKDPERMKEILQGTPPSYDKWGSPAPKPVGEFVMYLAPDMSYPVFDFDLHIEESILWITASFEEGFSVRVKVCIDPEENLMLVEWWTEGFKGNRYLGDYYDRQPIRFSLFREAEKNKNTFNDAYMLKYGFMQSPPHKNCIPLEKPEVEKMKGSDHPYVIQRFQPELTYPKGFEYAMSVFGQNELIAVGCDDSDIKGIAVFPKDPYEGKLCVGIESTGLDGSRAVPKLKRLYDLAADLESLTKEIELRVKSDSEAFWLRASLETEDQVFEKGWYETLYLQRCVFKSGKQAPGLFMPSTIQDYSLWKGDYHTNYNIQNPFYGLNESNHPELFKPFIELMVQWFLPMGKMIAEKYYHCRGCFIQLSGWPMLVAEDPLGCMPMGRMAYATGWIPGMFWQHYRYTMDEDYLRETGYPFIRECALFYHDFLTLEEDGLYHIFPSNEGEDGFSGSAEQYKDGRTVMIYIRECLHFAIEAAKIVRPDDELLPGLIERFEQLAPPRGEEWPKLDGLALHRWENSTQPLGKVLLPYHGGNYLYSEEDGMPEKVEEDKHLWYFGHMMNDLITAIRCGDDENIRSYMSPHCPLKNKTVFNITRKMMVDWRRKNGSFLGMSRAIYGYAGVFTESFGINGVIAEMLVQSFDGAIAVFPRWPLNKKMAFRNMRAEGAFLVSASCAEGKVTEINIISEKGGLCAVYMPESARVTCAGVEVEVGKDIFERPAFETVAGNEYKIRY